MKPISSTPLIQIIKSVILSLTMLTLAVTCFSQDVVKDKAYFISKSKKQKSAGFGLLIGGVVAVGVGLLIGNSSESTFDDAATGAIIGGVGVLSMLGSIPLFIASGKNKRKAELMVKTISLPPYHYTASNKQFQVGFRMNF